MACSHAARCLTPHNRPLSRLIHCYIQWIQAEPRTMGVTAQTPGEQTAKRQNTRAPSLASRPISGRIGGPQDHGRQTSLVRNRPAPCQEHREHDHAHPHPCLALHKPGLRAVWQLSTILAQTTSIVSAGFRSDTKTLRSTRASSGRRSNRCSRSSCSGHRVILASCFWTSLALICTGMGQQQVATEERPLLP